MKIETLQDATNYVIDGMREGEGLQCLAEQESICLAEEAERYVSTYLLQEDFPHNPFAGVEELEKATGVAYSVLLHEVATAIEEWLLENAE